MPTPEDIEDFGKQKLDEMLASGKEFVIVAGSIDFFGDSVPCVCGACGKAVVVRPWLYEEIVKHCLKVICKNCVSEPVLKGQIATDLKEMADKVKG